MRRARPFSFSREREDSAKGWTGTSSASGTSHSTRRDASALAGPFIREERGRRPYSVLLTSIFLLVLSLAPLQAFAVNPDEVLRDPALEARARHISMELRCMVCQNQSIDDSNADLARDLRLLVRKRLVDGDSDRQVLDYIVSRYGEFVLLKPRFSEKTWLLWGTPLALLGLGGIALVVRSRRGRGAPTGTRLTIEEEARLNEILSK
jgi:cytochrome c-type biogenesis protein CcmH